MGSLKNILNHKDSYQHLLEHGEHIWLEEERY